MTPLGILVLKCIRLVTCVQVSLYYQQNPNFFPQISCLTSVNVLFFFPEVLQHYINLISILPKLQSGFKFPLNILICSNSYSNLPPPLPALFTVSCPQATLRTKTGISDRFEKNKIITVLFLVSSQLVTFYLKYLMPAS